MREEKIVLAQLSEAERMLKDAEKAQKMAYSSLNQHLQHIPKEHKGVIDDLMRKVGKLQKTHDPKMAQKLQNEVNDLIRKQRENASKDTQ